MKFFLRFCLLKLKQLDSTLLKANLTAILMQQKNVVFERAQFMRRVQQPNENVDDCITCLHSLVDRCDYRAIKDEIGLED